MVKTSQADGEEGLDELRTATLRLTEQVGMLSTALKTVNDVQKRQLELAAQVQSVKEDVAENAVPKHEFQQAQATGAIQRQKLQTRIRVFAITTACVALAVSITASVLSYYANRHAVDAKVASEHNSRVAVCQQRNKDAIENSKKSKIFFAPYVAQEEHNPKADPVLLAILQAIADTPPQITNCNF